jgi:hypothetical protein
MLPIVDMMKTPRANEQSAPFTALSPLVRGDLLLAIFAFTHRRPHFARNRADAHAEMQR